jgi:O-antigen/teichoic acid export membrane protein
VDLAETTQTRLTRNAALLFGARVTSALTTLAVLAIISRTRGPEELGLVSLGLAAGAILAVLSDLGLGSLMVREASRDDSRTNVLLGAALLMRLVTVPTSLAIAWLISAAVYGPDALVVWLPAAGLVLQQWADLTRSVSLAQRRFGLVAAHSIVENLVWVATIAALLLAGLALNVALLGGALAFGVSVVAGLIIVRAIGARPILPTAAEATRLARVARSFSAFTSLNIAFSRLDTLLVGLLAPSQAVVAAGAYYAANRLVAAFDYLPEALTRSLFPDLSRSFALNPASVARLLHRPTRFLLFVGIPVPFVVLVVGPWLMTSLYGPVIGTFSWILVGLAALVPIRFVSSLTGIALTSADAQGRRVLGAALALTAVAAVDVALIPRVGVAGALFGAAAANVTLLTIYLTNARRVLGVGLTLGGDALVAIVASVGAISVAIASRTFVPDPTPAVAFGIAYVTLLGGITAIRAAQSGSSDDARLAGGKADDDHPRTS